VQAIRRQLYRGWGDGMGGARMLVGAGLSALWRLLR
jgi:hypothetical protein